jgi:hypothetical protein
MTNSKGGIFTLIYKNGKVFEGIFKYANGEVYDGQVSLRTEDDKITGTVRNGQGTFTFANGGKYIGEFKDGQPHGQGTETYADGTKYIGEYKDGKKNGQGTYTFANGDQYIGEFKDNKKNGQGTETFANGNKYVGEFKDDIRNGQGTFTHADGSKLVGDFKNDKIRQGVSTNRDGSKYVGEFDKDGMIHGMGTYTFADGTAKKGIWAYDQISKQSKIVNEIPNDLMLSCKYSRSNGRIKGKYNSQDRFLRIHDYKKNKNSGNGRISYYQVSGYNNSRIDYQTEQQVTFFDDAISFQISYLIANWTYTINRSTLNLVAKFSGIFDGYNDNDIASEHYYRCRVFTDSEFADFIKKIHSDKLQEKQQREDLINRNKI